MQHNGHGGCILFIPRIAAFMQEGGKESGRDEEEHLLERMLQLLLHKLLTRFHGTSANA